MDTLKKVLVVEDDETVNGLMSLYLVRFPCKIFDAKDGLDGLATAIQIVPDLIITDLRMSRMDGIEFIKAVRAHQKLANVPILVFTGASSEDQVKAMGAGASMVLEKPVNHSVLRQAINVFLPLGK